ncbi:hypothetical protein [Paraburkholderia sacchari]|uniref:hypothetical protein n=1 Tax=Paraburkholderia sacchari TaxID=159450 RepID=UPI001BD0656C|nr:hypothetical protein [Paraburkholderia sacchari]
MNAVVELPAAQLERLSVGTALRGILAIPERAADAEKAVGMSTDDLRSLADGSIGIEIHRVNTLLGTTDHTLAPSRIFGAHVVLASVGAECWCAARGLSRCGANSAPLLPQHFDIEQIVREAFGNQREKQAILDVTGWDRSMPSKIIGPDKARITLEKLDRMMDALNYVLVPRVFYNAIRTLSVAGVYCQRAQLGAGVCGLDY